MAAVDALLIKIEREACKGSLYEFLLSFWDVLVPEELVANWHLKLICDEIQHVIEAVARREATHDLVINVPPGSTKTTIALQAAPAWAWAVDPTLRIITSSHKSGLSVKSSAKSRDILQSKKYRILFPDVQLRDDSSAKNAYENSKGGTRETASVDGSPTGIHAHIKIMDDLQEISRANSIADREQATEHMKALFSREVHKGKSVNILIMQRLHQLDCTAFLQTLKRDRGCKMIRLPAELSDLVSPPELKARYIDGLLDPVRMSRKVLDEKKIELGSYGYSSQFMQNPIPPEGNVVKREWIKTAPYHICHFPNDTVHFFVDTAYSAENTKKSKGEAINDPSAILAVTYRDGICYLLNYEEKYADIIELPKWIAAWAQRNRYSTKSVIYVEPKASGKSAVQMLRLYTKLNVAEIKGGKLDKTTELVNTAPSVEAGRFVLCEGAWNSLFIDRICGFPHVAHDEAVDLLCYARKHYFAGASTGVRQSILDRARAML